MPPNITTDCDCGSYAAECWLRGGGSPAQFNDRPARGPGDPVPPSTQRSLVATVPTVPPKTKKRSADASYHVAITLRGPGAPPALSAAMRVHVPDFRLSS